MKKFAILLFVSTVSLFGMAGSPVVIDKQHVYNPEVNACMQTFGGYLKTVADDRALYAEKTAELETVVLRWIEESPEAYYIKDMDQSNFYWQFVNDGASEKVGHFGVLLMVPQNEIKANFYTELGGGLMLSGKHLLDFNVPWTNDGELFSFVVNKTDMSVQHFKNWRFGYQPLKEDERVYYATLELNFNEDEDAKESVIYQYVDSTLREISNGYADFDFTLPKGRISTFVIYQEDELKGIICYNMKNIGLMCPMDYATTVYFGEGVNPQRILYAEPECSDIYPFTWLADSEDKASQSLFEWINDEFFSPYQDIVME